MHVRSLQFTGPNTRDALLNHETGTLACLISESRLFGVGPSPSILAETQVWPNSPASEAASQVSLGWGWPLLFFPSYAEWSFFCAQANRVFFLLSCAP